MLTDIQRRAVYLMRNEPEVCREIAQQLRSVTGMSLTVKQRECFNFIRSYMADNDGRAPNFTEMMVSLDVQSKSRVHALLEALQDRGFIRRIPRGHRAIQILRAAPADQPVKEPAPC